jgi:hypothetical protein
MAYFGVTFASGLRIIVDATNHESAREIAQKEHPQEEIIEVVYLTIVP